MYALVLSKYNLIGVLNVVCFCFFCSGAKEVLRQAFVVFSERIIKIPFEEGSFVDNPIADEEFLDYDDFLQHLGNMRTQVGSIAAQLDIILI